MEELVINYHMTEKCNYSCLYCFAKYGLDEQFQHELHHNPGQVKQLLQALYQHFSARYAVKRIRLNLAGGEPLLLASIQKIIDMAKEIGFEISIITNSSPLTKKFIEKNAAKLGVVGLSMDSFLPATNVKIGRCDVAKRMVSMKEIQSRVALLRKKNPNIILKINTVVSELNWNEQMSAQINSLMPDKWKIFKEIRRSNLPLEEKLFKHFVKTNADQVFCPVYAENNTDMTNSYLMIDPLGRFYQNSDGVASYHYSDRILQAGVSQALKQITFDINKFKKRYIPLEKQAEKLLVNKAGIQPLFQTVMV